MENDIENVIAMYSKLRQQRANLEKLASEIKGEEEKLKANLMMRLDALGLSSVKANGITISKTCTIRPEIVDHAALQEVMYNLMTAAHNEGRPLQDGLLLQRTVAKNAVLAYIREHAGLEESDVLDTEDEKVKAVAKSIGLNLRAIPDLSIRKS